MTSRICMCCGELMPEEGNVLSRNPNICASCSSLADGMDDMNGVGAATPPPAVEPEEARNRAEARPSIEPVPRGA